MNYSVNLSSPKWSNLRWLTQYGLAQVDKSTSLYSPNCWSTQFCHIFCKESANFVIFVLSILSPFSIGLWQELILELSSHSLTLFHYDSWFESQLRIDSYVDATWEVRGQLYHIKWTWGWSRKWTFSGHWAGTEKSNFPTKVTTAYGTSNAQRTTNSNLYSLRKKRNCLRQMK